MTSRRFEFLTSVPGIGPVTATTLPVEMKDRGSANAAAEVAALAGIGIEGWDTDVCMSCCVGPVDRKKTQRLCREEGLTVRRRKPRRRIAVSPTPIPLATGPNSRRSIDFVHD